jgi:hypothetical protein
MTVLYIYLAIIVVFAALFVIGALVGGKRRDEIGIQWADEQKAKRQERAFTGSKCGHV